MGKERVDQVVECFPNTLPKNLPDKLSKMKWSKKTAEVGSWSDWWEMHEEIEAMLSKQATHITKWWEYIDKPYPGDQEIIDSLKRLLSGVLTHPVTIGKVIDQYTPKRKKDKPNPIHPIKLTLVSPDPANKQLANDCGPKSPMLINQRCKLTAWDGFYHDFWQKWIKTRKVETPDIAMGIHPGLHAEGVWEYWEPTIDLLLEENILTIFTVFNKEEFRASVKRLDGMYARYKYKGPNQLASDHVKQTPHDPDVSWTSNRFLIVFQGRTVDMNTMIRIEDPELDKAEAEFEKLLSGSSE